MALDATDDLAGFLDALQGLAIGDFSRLDTFFEGDQTTGKRPQILDWHEQGLFS